MPTALRSYTPREKLVSGVTDLATKRPDLMNLWAPNNELNPLNIHPGSNAKAYWLCPQNGHLIQRVIAKFAQTQACSICSGAELLSGFNDLATTHPELAAQWAPENSDSPAHVSSGSKTPVTWLCSKEHSYEASPHNRKNGRGCPYCSGSKAIVGETDLATVAPRLAAELADSALAYRLTAGSGRPVLWNCSTCTHSWETSPAHRSAGSGCPDCAASSALEAKVKEELQARGLRYVRNHRKLRRIDREGFFELDFYLPEFKIVFEVQDFATHSKVSDHARTKDPRFGAYKRGPAYHRLKTEACNAAGVRLIELWEDSITSNEFKKTIEQEIIYVTSH